jgi:hypothetical protein
VAISFHPVHFGWNTRNLNIKTLTIRKGTGPGSHDFLEFLEQTGINMKVPN